MKSQTQLHSLTRIMINDLPCPYFHSALISLSVPIGMISFPWYCGLLSDMIAPQRIEDDKYQM